MQIHAFYFDNYHLDKNNPAAMMLPYKTRHTDSGSMVWHVLAASQHQALRLIKQRKWTNGTSAGIVEQRIPNFPPEWKRYDGGRDLVPLVQPGQRYC